MLIFLLFLRIIYRLNVDSVSEKIVEYYITLRNSLSSSDFLRKNTVITK